MDDIALLGSAIFSMGHRITHWDGCGDLLSNENRSWFVVAFSRLKELTEADNQENSRIILFPDFAILKTKLEKLRAEKGVSFDEEAIAKLETVFEVARKQSDFGNGRYARNI